MRKLAVFLLFLLISIGFAADGCAYFFYGEGCPHCARAEDAIDALLEEGYVVERFEVYGSGENAQMLNRYFEAYQVPMEQRGVPVAFFGNSYLVGDLPIIENLPRGIDGAECPSLGAENTSGSAGEASELEGSVSIWLLTGAAVVDSINPCAIAVLLILLAALMAAGDKKRAVLAGLAFTSSLYLAYFLFGLGLLSAIQVSGLSSLFYQFVGILAIVVGLANLKDYFWYGGGGFVMEVPRSWRPALKGILNKATSAWGAFLIGFVVCLFELPCTGGPYLFILGLLAEKTTRVTAVPLLLYYNLVFVVPLLVITGIFYFGYSNLDRMGKWKDKNIRLLHLVAGLLMVGLGLSVLLT